MKLEVMSIALAVDCCGIGNITWRCRCNDDECDVVEDTDADRAVTTTQLLRVHLPNQQVRLIYNVSQKGHYVIKL